MNLKFPRSQQQGFSLVELLVSIVIGLLLVVGVLQAFISSKETYTMQSGLAKLQENGRFAMTFIARDIRQAGYSGCSRNATVSNVLRNASGALPSLVDFENPLVATEGGADPDSIQVLFSDSSNICEIANHNTGSETIRCEAAHPYEVGDIVVATDCEHTAVFQVHSIGGGSDRVRHRQLAGSDIGNCTEGVGTPVDCSSVTGNLYSFDIGTVMALNSFRYYIDNNDWEEPALYRDSLLVEGAYEVGTRRNELVEGVEDMQILYGEDTNGDGTANYYVPADQIANVDDVISVRVSLLIRSIEDTIVRDGQTINFNGANATFNDGRLRKVFTSTIALRNRL